MRKKLLSLALIFVMLLGMLPPVALAAGPVSIASEADLKTISGSGNYVLTADITLTEAWTPIPNFSGTLDGGGHTISGLTVNVTSGNAGLFGDLSGSVNNLILVQPQISGSGTNVGALAGQLSSAYAVIQNCGVTGGTVSSTSSSAYVGGLVGFIKSGGTFSGCYSTASVSSGKYAGGLTSNAAGTMKLSNCYATGTVAGNSAHGGMIGYSYLYSGKLTCENCYAAPDLTGSGTSYGFSNLQGSASCYSVTNCFYDSTKIAAGDSRGKITGKPTDELKAVPSELGEGFQPDSGNINGGYPILAWQYTPDPDSVWTVKLTVVPKEAILTWNGTPQDVAPDGVYTFSGIKYETVCNWSVDYTYGDYAPQSGSITVKRDVAQTITLAPNLHQLTFNLTPSDAELVVKSGGETLTPEADTTYAVPKGDYTYTASAFGYADSNSTVTVGTEDKTETVALTPNAAQAVTFSYGSIPAGGGEVAANAITVTTADGAHTISSNDGLTFSLPIGYTYTYTFKSAGYAKKTDTIDLTGATEVGTQQITIPLEVKTAWDGTTTEQPKGSGTTDDPYQITSGEELAWLAEEVNKANWSSGDFNATLVRNIDLGNENWTPIGKNSSYYYKWTFDGQGHTIKGLHVQSETYNQGLFGYVRDAAIKGLTIEGSVTGGGKNSSSGVGGIVGTFAGTGRIENCVNKANVNADTNYVGGIVGYIPFGSNRIIQNCANLGNVTGNSGVGGLVGYFYSVCTLKNCYNIGAVEAKVDKAGGIAGYTYDSNAVISNCYTTGAVSAPQNVSPVIGMMSQGKPDKNSIFYLDSLGTDSNGTSVTGAELKAVPEALGSAFLADTGNINDGYPILDFQVTKYTVTFTVSPTSAKVEIPGFVGTQEDNKWTFQLPDGIYNYTVSCLGYEEQRGSLTVSGADVVAKPISLPEAPKKQVGFEIKYSDNATGVTPTVEVTWNGETLEASGPNTYSLPYGEYRYTVKAKGYGKTTGTFTVDANTADTLTISVVLNLSKAWDGESTAQPSGAGTAASPYQIGTGEELAWLADYVNQGNGETAHAVLTADIDLGDQPWTPMGNSYSIKYKSVFDGQGHAVSGLNVSGAEYAGLFGQAEKATIKNMIVQGSVQGTGRTAGLLGYAYADCTVQNCGNEATVTGSGTWTGGIVGYIGSYYDKGSSIVSCYNTGSVTATGSTSNYAGGILGYDYAGQNVIFTDCYNAGTITGSGYAGGIRAYGSSMIGALVNCYNVGPVSGAETGKTGAITPGSSSIVTNCYYLESVVSDQNSGAIAKSDTDLKLADFLALLNGSGSTWKQDPFTNNGYPILSWQETAGPAESDTPTVADAHFLMVVETVEDGRAKITPYLVWKPLKHTSSYTVMLWSERLSPSTDPEIGYTVVHEQEAVLTVTNVVGERASELTMADVVGQEQAELWGDNVAFSIGYGEYDPQEWLYCNLQKQLDELGESRYYATVTATGAEVPSAKFVWGTEDSLDEVYAGDVQMAPYNRMNPITNLRWEGTKACWDPKPYFDGDEDGYALTLYQKDSSDKWVEGRTLDVPGSYSKLNCVSYFTVGGIYKFTVTALDDAAFGYSESPVSAFSPEYAVQAEEELGQDWTAITSAEQWMALANLEDTLEDPSDPTSSLQGQAWSKRYYLTNDLDFSNLSADWETKTKSIGNVNNPFMGTLDGRGHKITGLTLSNYDSGLFWYVGATGQIQDLTIEGANILVSDNAAVLAHNNKGTIRRCAVVNSNITADTGAVIGGMVSRNYGVIEDSYVEGGLLRSNTATATGHAGFTGSNEEGGVIERCWTSMDVVTRSDYAGGFVGLGYGGTIRDCFALGDVTARSYSGGFVGRSVYNGNLYQNCYAAGTVTLTGEADPGEPYYGQELHGFIGGNQPHSGLQYDQSEGIVNCWFNAATETAANYGAQPKALADMKTDAFVSILHTGSAEQTWTRAEDKNAGLPYLLTVKPPEQAATTQITVTIALASYDKTSYTFEQFGAPFSVTLDSTGNTRVVDVLDAAQAQGKLTYSYDTTATFGRYIHTINGRAVEAPDGWMFTVNDQLSNVSASLATVKTGDKILWYEGTTENHFQGPTWAELENSTLEWVEISTLDQLLTLADSAGQGTSGRSVGSELAALGKNYRLTADLDLNGVAFPGIGSADHPFTGIFDGQGHTVANAVITGSENVGFFNVMKGATVKDLHLTGLQVTGEKTVGGLVGWAQTELNVRDMSQSEACLVGGCTVSGAVSGRDTVGGLMGLNDGKTDPDTQFSIDSAVNQCTADVAVTGKNDGASADRAKIGGLVGDNAGVVTQSVATGDIAAGDSNMVGGLLGSNTGDVYGSRAEGTVTGAGTVGGFAGSSSGLVKDSCALGDVTGTDTVGGFAGSLYAAENVASAGTVTGTTATGGLAGHLSGQVVGTSNQITVKNAYGHCTAGQDAVGNASSFSQSPTAPGVLAGMKLPDKPATASKIYEMFGINLKVPEALKTEADKYADSLFIPRQTAVGTALDLLKADATPTAGITVSYEMTSPYLTASGSTLTLAKQNNTPTGLTEQITLVLTDTKGNVFRKPVTVVLPASVNQATLMDAIAATLTGSSDGWTVLDMARYAGLPGKTLKTTAQARQNALNLLIAEAAGTEASVSDRARLELVLRAMGVDSTQLYPADSTTAVNNAALLAWMDLTANGYYAAPWLLLADLQGNLNLTAAQQNSLIQLLKTNLNGGLFSYTYNGISYTDPDTAGAALAALAQFYPANSEAKTVVNTILAALPGAMGPSGSLGNANADAMVILGLIALGKDPAELKAASGASLVDGLMSHANTAGTGFLYNGGDNALATEQGFRALVALAAFDGTTPYNLYDFSAVSVQPGRATGTGTETPPAPPVGKQDITVTLSIQADTGYWLEGKSVTVKEGSTVYHALLEALKGTGITQRGAASGYVKSMTKDGVTLSEFGQGKNSGWLYKVNGLAPSVALTQYTLSPEDDILWYYTADWQTEPDLPGSFTPPVLPLEKPFLFTDVSQQAWYYEAVQYVFQNDLMTGVSEDRFAPDLTLSRAMLATILWRIEDTPAPTATADFTDLSRGSWYADAVAWAAEKGIVQGYGNATFRPDLPITREQLAVMFWRYAGSPSSQGTLDRFTDGNTVSPWAVTALRWAVKEGIVTGKGDGILDPTGTATRAEAAAVLMRWLSAKN